MLPLFNLSILALNDSKLFSEVVTFRISLIKSSASSLEIDVLYSTLFLIILTLFDINFAFLRLEPKILLYFSL